jgi:hypothetical protein
MRPQDTGLGVRKRVMKLLKSLYDTTNDRSRKVDICIKMIHRLQDEDETVKVCLASQQNSYTVLKLVEGPCREVRGGDVVSTWPIGRSRRFIYW